MARWPRSWSVAMTVGEDSRYIGEEWAARCAQELEFALDPPDAKTPEEKYQIFAGIAKRWYDYQIAELDRKEVPLPLIERFDIVYHSGPDRSGDELATVDVLSGRVECADG